MTYTDIRRLFVRFGVGVAGLVIYSSTSSAHEFGNGGVGHGGAAAAFAVVLGLPILAGLAAGVVAVRYSSLRRSEPADQSSSIAVGLLLIGLGVVSFLPAVGVYLWLSVAGGIIGVTIALCFVSDRAIPGIGCENHVELTLGAISTHRMFEGIVLGTLYSAGAAVGLLGAVVLAVHTALETAAVGRLYDIASSRTKAIGAIILVQAGYVGGAAAGLGIASAVPVTIRIFALAVVGGALLIVGMSETERSIAAGSSVLIG